MLFKYFFCGGKIIFKVVYNAQTFYIHLKFYVYVFIFYIKFVLNLGFKLESTKIKYLFKYLFYFMRFTVFENVMGHTNIYLNISCNF